MNSNCIDNKGRTSTIAKNAVILYVRMGVTMLITLFTSRIVLQTLGINDYGLYSVISGVVTLFTFLRSSMSSSTQRFLSYEMGNGTKESLKRVFSVCLTTHFMLAIIMLVLSETIGLWFVNTQLNIPADREEAAGWVYQFTVLALCLRMISLPYEADLVSNERMGFYAFLSIFEAVLKLALAYVLFLSNGDRLILYSALMLSIPVISLFLNWAYCHRKFEETHYNCIWDKQLFKQIFSFSSWTIYGQLAVVGSNQGTNILVNIFHNVAANAAMGVGHQVNTALTGLVSNFQTAFKPQITKSYASGDFQYLTDLTCYASKISYFLLLLASLPIVMNIDFVLDLWLDKVPEYSAWICIIFIGASLCNAVSGPLWMNIFATGHVKNYQLALSFFYVAELFIVYALFYMKVPLLIGVSMKAVLNFIVIFVRLYYAHITQKQFSLYTYCLRVLLPLLYVTLIVIASCLPVLYITHNVIIRLAATLFPVVLSIFSIYYIGMNSQERESCRKLLFKKKLIK